MQINEMSQINTALETIANYLAQNEGVEFKLRSYEFQTVAKLIKRTICEKLVEEEINMTNDIMAANE